MNIFITDLETAWEVLKADILKAETWLVSIVKQLWIADVQIIMNDLQKALTGYAVQLQNEQPGIDSKAMFAQLAAAVSTQFVELGAQLAYADIMLVVSIVVKGTNVAETTGNAGVVS